MVEQEAESIRHETTVVPAIRSDGNDADMRQGENVARVGGGVPVAVTVGVALLLAEGGHPNIVRLSAPQVADDSSEAAVSEVAEANTSGLATTTTMIAWCDGCDLHDHVITHGKLNKESTVALFCQLLSALVHLHDKGIVHGNVIAKNIILHHGSFLLSGFDSADLIGDDDSEVKDVDMLGAGATLYFAVTGVSPDEGAKLDFGSPFHGVDPMLRDLIITLLTKDELHRVSAKRALEIVHEALDKKPSDPIAPYPRYISGYEPSPMECWDDPDENISGPTFSSRYGQTCATTTCVPSVVSGVLQQQLSSLPYEEWVVNGDVLSVVRDDVAMEAATMVEQRDARHQLRRDFRNAGLRYAADNGSGETSAPATPTHASATCSAVSDTLSQEEAELQRPDSPHHKAAEERAMRATLSSPTHAASTGSAVSDVSSQGDAELQ